MKGLEQSDIRSVGRTLEIVATVGHPELAGTSRCRSETFLHQLPLLLAVYLLAFQLQSLSPDR
jgi:hypothetical protein